MKNENIIAIILITVIAGTLIIGFYFGFIYQKKKEIPDLIIRIVNESGNDINVTIMIFDSSNTILLNDTYHINKGDEINTGKIINKADTFRFSLFVDENRKIDKNLLVNELHSSPSFHIRDDEIQIGQKIV